MGIDPGRTHVARVDSHLCPAAGQPGIIKQGTSATRSQSTDIGKRRHLEMHLIRSIPSLVLMVALTACITDPGPIGTNEGSTGRFSITVPEFANGPTNGNATFSLDQVEGNPVVTVEMSDNTGISITLSGPGSPVVGDEREIGDDDGFMNGEVVRTSGTAAGRYVMTAGRFIVEGSSGSRLVGQLEFTAVQQEGASVGSVIHGSGNFSASGGNAQP